MYEIALSYIYCQEDSDEIFNDEPYVVVFAVDLASARELADFLPGFAVFDDTLYGPFPRMSASFVPDGSIRGRPVQEGLCWLRDAPGDIDFADDAVILVALLESDTTDQHAEIVASGGALHGLGGLLNNLPDFLAGNIDRDTLVDRLRSQVKNGLDQFRGADDRLGPVLELRLTTDDLLAAQTEIVEKKLTIRSRSEESEYDLTFQLGLGPGSVSRGLGSAGPSDRYAAIWTRDQGPEWSAQHRLDAKSYQQAFEEHARNGQRPVHVGGYTWAGKDRYAGIWEKAESTPWAARHGLDAWQYQDEFTSLTTQGFRPVRVSGYRGRGKDLYAAIFEKREGPAWVARHRLTTGEMQAEYYRLLNEGYRLVDISGYQIAGTPRYAGIWEKAEGPPLEARWGMSPSGYQQNFEVHARRGYRLVHVSGYRVSGNIRFAAIWEEREGPEWVARHGMTSEEYQEAFEANLSEGYRLVCVSGY